MMTRIILALLVVHLFCGVKCSFAQQAKPQNEQEVKMLFDALSRGEQTKASEEKKDASNPAPVEPSKEGKGSEPTIRELYKTAYGDAQRAASQVDFDESLKAIGKNIEAAGAEIEKMRAEPAAEPGPRSNTGEPHSGLEPKEWGNRSNNSNTGESYSAIENKATQVAAVPPAQSVANERSEGRIEPLPLPGKEDPSDGKEILETVCARLSQLSERVKRLEQLLKLERDDPR